LPARIVLHSGHVEGNGADHHAEIVRMQEGVRRWVRRHGAGRANAGMADTGTDGAETNGRQAGRLPPLALLAALTASACCPLLAVGAGAVTLAGVGVVSAMGTGVLSGLLTSALDRARERQAGNEASPSALELEEAVAAQLRSALAGSDEQARLLRTDIAEVLREVDAGGVAVRAVMDSGNAQLGQDIARVLGDIGDGFGELRFLIEDLTGTATSIQQMLDAQGAEVQGVREQNYWQATNIRLILSTVQAMEARSRPAGGNAAGRLLARSRLAREQPPYRGLLPFGEADSKVFYGRARLTAELAATAARQITRGGMVIVTGASGAGKSSLLTAGLLPAMARGAAGPGPSEWARLVITPSEAPLARLAAALESLGGRHGGSLRGMLADYPSEAAAFAQQAVDVHMLRRSRELREPARLVLIVDQFEQLFTLNPGLSGDGERLAFITALCAMGTVPALPGRPPPAFVILAVRGDFSDRCAEYPVLGSQLRDGQFAVGPMTEAELRLAITGPAETAGLWLEHSLTDTIMSDLRARARTGTGLTAGADGAGVLPLLSEAMFQTWENRDDSGRLTIEGYELTGGVGTVVARRADKVYDSLTEQQQAAARDAFRRMTVAGRADGDFARRPVNRADLYTGHAAADVDAVLETLAAERLVVLDQKTASISHDVLLREWPTLRSWLDRDRSALILRDQLADDTARWRGRSEEGSFLYRGAQLAGIHQALADWSSDPGRYPRLTEDQRGFLAASDRAETRRVRLRRLVLVTLALSLLAALVGGGLAGLAAHQEHQQTLSAVSGQVAGESEALDRGDPVTAAQLAAAAWRIDPTPLARDSLLDIAAQPLRASLSADAQIVRDLAFSPDGAILATASDDGTARLWDTATHRQIGTALRTDSKAVNSVAFSPDGTMLATASSDGTARLWNVATHHQIGPALRVDSKEVSAVAFSPDGQTLAAVSSDRSVWLWDVATHREVGRLVSPVPADAVAFSPSGIIATANGLSVTLWNAATQEPIGTPIVPDYPPQAVTFNPAGTILATSTISGNIQLWDVTTRQQVGTTMSSGSFFVAGLAFSPDGTLLASGSQISGHVQLWSVATHREVLSLPANGYAEAVAFSPDGATLGVADGGGAQLFDLRSFRPAGQPMSADSRTLGQVTFSPDGAILATASFDGTVRLWSVATQHKLGRPIAADSGYVYAVAFSPSGRTIATGGAGAVVRLWNITTHQQIGTAFPSQWPGTKKPDVKAIAFSPDGTILVAAFSSGRVVLWDVATRQQIGAPITASGPIDTMALSPDARTLATSVEGGQLQLWNVATHQQIGGPLPALPSPQSATALAFSPDGQTLAIGDSGGTSLLWNVASRQQIGLPLGIGQGSNVGGLAFSPHGTYLATVSSLGQIDIWDVQTRQEIGEPITDSEPLVSGFGYQTIAFNSDGTTIAAGGAGGTATLWNVSLPADPINLACAAAGGSLTMQQWNSYVPSLPYVQVCPEEPS
jgi:WD40 repeat protein